MDFFKSILSDDPDPDPQNPEYSKDVQVDPDPNSQKPDSGSAAADGGGSSDGGVWSFGSLFKTISTQSESVLETYRRDLQEFGSGLKKETELFREVATRAVKDLPNSIDTLLASSEVEPEPENETSDTNRILNSGRYSRFDSHLMNIQTDPNTFCVDPEDLEEYKKWKSEFDLKEKSKEVENLIGENGSLESMYKRVVPNEVENETFWCRYFYKVYKLKQQESVRAKLVNRAMSIDDDEELSWDVDDDDDADDDNERERNTRLKVDEHGKENEKEVSVVERSVDEVKKMFSDESESANQDWTNVAKEVPKQDSMSIAKELPTNKGESSKEDSTNVVKQATHSDESQTLISAAVDKKEENQSNVDGGGKSQVVESSGKSKDSKKEETEVASLGKEEEGVVKGDRNESGKDGDVPIASSHKTGADEDDLDWAEIEDIEGNDDKKATSHVASSNRADLRKTLSVEEDDEDLSWDIEDDD